MSLHKAFGLSVGILFSCMDSTAQGYYIRMETLKVRLYAGYVNSVALNIVHPGDTTTYAFHAQADGATIDYDERGRLRILPYAKKGVVRVFAEKAGKYYKVNNDLIYESVAAPADDAAFIMTMGITSADDKKRIKKPKKFSLPAGVQAIPSNFYLGGVTMSELRTDEINAVFVTILKSGGEYLVPQEGDIQISSRDARIKKVDARTFNISPLPNLKRCRLEFTFNGERVGEETVTIWNPNN